MALTVSNVINIYDNSDIIKSLSYTAIGVRAFADKLRLNNVINMINIFKQISIKIKMLLLNTVK